MASAPPNQLTPFPREVLNSAFNGDVRMIQAFEELLRELQGAVDTVTTAGESVTGIAATEFVLAAASSALASGRVLTNGRGISINLGSGTVTISHPIEAQGGDATFLFSGTTTLAFPATGVVATREYIAAFFVALAASTSYADDTAAAAGGVAVGQPYRNGSVVQVRVT